MFTKGKWQFDSVVHQKHKHFIINRNQSAKVIAVTYPPVCLEGLIVSDEKERKANARLICTAPLGYQLAEMVLKYEEDVTTTDAKHEDSGIVMENIVALARQIVANVKGE